MEGPHRTNAAGKTDKVKKSGEASGSSFADMISGDSPDITGAAAPTAVAGVNLFVALQAAEHATEQEERRRALVRADDLLEELDELRIGLLLGTYTKAQLERLAARLRDQRGFVTDPKLMALLDDVELRAAVELAKYS